MPVLVLVLDLTYDHSGFWLCLDSFAIFFSYADLALRHARDALFLALT